jgi:hypothetical protein
MAIKPVDPIVIDQGSGAGADHASYGNRRKRPRTRVHWPVVLMPDRNPGSIETLTQDLSSSGFYCLCPQALTVGESLLCTLKVPAYDPGGGDRIIALECRVVVMRSEPKENGAFGIACRVEDYHLLSGGAGVG